MNSYIKLTFLLFVLLLNSCKEDGLNVDVESVENSIEVKHYDKALFQLKPSELPDALQSLQAEFQLFLGNDYKSPANTLMLQEYLTKPSNRKMMEDIDNTFGDYADLDEQIKNAFDYYYYYYPNDSMPNVYTYVSELLYEQAIIVSEQGILIGIDLYSGNNEEAFKQLRLPNFVSKRFEKRHLVSDLMRNIAKLKFQDYLGGTTMLENIIALGKIEYFVEAMVPNEQDSVRFIYTPKQMNWCNNRESAFWKHLTMSEMLFSKDYHEFKRYIEDRPFASSLERESPGRAGVWIGYKIVKAYMEKKSDVTLQELMIEPDLNKIFKGSKYNPN